MRVAILTLPLHTNYGGILQAYALQTVLEKLGHKSFDVEIEQFPKVKIHWLSLPLRMTKRGIYKVLHKQTTDIFYELKYNIIELPKKKKYFLRYRGNTEKFIKKYINRVFILNYSSISELCPDAIIVGSDQVWRWRYRGCFGGTSNAFLGFAEGLQKIKKIAYAASFGLDEWEYSFEDSKIAKELIAEFDAVSVREKSALKLCKQYLNYSNAVNVLDPTMLLEKEDYLKLFSKFDQNNARNKIFSYVIDITDDYISFEKEISAKIGLPFYHVMTPENTGEERTVAPVEKWLSAIYNSEMVITDSFHGTVFCLIFNKPFWVMGNRDGGYARFRYLLSTFGLESRLVQEGDLTKDWKAPINWASVNNKRQELKDLSLTFLKQNLKES